MPLSAHRLPRALLLSVGLHLGLGVWLWTRSEPKAPPAAPLQVPVTLQFVEVEPPAQAAPPQPGVGPTTPSRRTSAPRSPRRPSTLPTEAAESPDSQGGPGGVHPYFSTLGRSMLQHWSPEHLLAIQGFEGSFGLTPSAHREVARVMSKRAEADASTDAPLDPQTLERDRHVLRQKTKEQLRAARHATVFVFQDARGRVFDVRVVSSSYDRYMDVLVADSIRRAAERQPPLSPEVFQGREIQVSQWQLELIVSESPPGPSDGLAFEAEMALTELHLPLNQHLYKRVRLLCADAGLACLASKHP